MIDRGTTDLGDDTATINLTFIFLLLTLVSTIIVGVGVVCEADGSCQEVQVYQGIRSLPLLRVRCVSGAHDSLDAGRHPYSLYHTEGTLRSEQLVCERYYRCVFVEGSC